MFGFGEKKIKLANAENLASSEVISNKKNVKQRKRHNVFDVWAYRNNLYILSEHCLLDETSNFRKDVLERIDDEKSIFKYLDDKNERIKKTFISNNTDSILECINDNQIEIEKSNQAISLAKELNEQLNEFEIDVKFMIKKLGENQAENIKSLLIKYADNGVFDAECFDFKVKGFFNVLFFGISAMQKHKCLNNFIKKYEKSNILNEINLISKKHYGTDAGYILFSRLSTIAYNDFETSAIWSKNLETSFKKINKNIKIAEKRIEENKAIVEDMRLAVEQSCLYKRERKIVLNFCKKNKKM